MSSAISDRLISRRRIVLVVMLCHFIAAFAALGMPPFFALILDKSLHNQTEFLAGWFYVVPTLFAALSSPWWGKLADHLGKRPLLIRAQLGLAGSFLLAGFATETWVFLLALILQGILGGTFAASNAYLATVVHGSALTRSLTAMQWSARAALVVAPVCVGLWMSVDSPIVLYRYLALLPLVAALMIARLPQGGTAGRDTREVLPDVRQEATAGQIHALQFAFVFATVVTFPYFIPHVQQYFPWLSVTLAGVLFGLPHLVYLAISMPLARWLGKRNPLKTLTVMYLAFIFGLIGQTWPASIEWLIICRLLMGAAMTGGFVALHALVAGVVKSDAAGRTFGWFESSSKWGGVGAGLGAGMAAAALGTNGPFVIGAIVIAAAAAYALVLTKNQLRLSNP